MNLSTEYLFSNRTFISKDKLENVYAFVGDSYHWICALIYKLQSTLGAVNDLNRSLYFSEDQSWRDVIAECDTLPFMSDKRLIVIKNITKIEVNDEKLVLRYIASPNPSTYLILNFTQLGYKQKKTNKIYNELSKKRCVLEMPVPDRYSFKNILNLKKKKGELNITRSAEEMFLTLMEPSWDTFINELEKISLYAGNNTVIDDNELLSILATNKAPEMERLIDGIFMQDKMKVTTILNDNPIDEKNIVLWLGILRWNIRILIELSSISSDYEKESILKKNRIFSTSKIDSMIKYARGRTSRHFSYLLQIVMEMDDNLRKRSGQLFKINLERMILKMSMARGK